MLWSWTTRQMCSCVCLCVPFASSVPSICENNHVFVLACCVLSCLACECAVAVCLACCLQNTPHLVSVHECVQTSTPSRVSMPKPNQAFGKPTKEHERKSRHLQKQHASKQASEQNKTATKQAIKKENGESMEKSELPAARQPKFFPKNRMRLLMSVLRCATLDIRVL